MSDHHPDPSAFESPAHVIDRGIYSMPVFVSLEVSDLASSSEWYQRALGFVELAAIPAPHGSVALIHLRRYRYQDLLLRASEGPVTPSPDASVGLAFAGTIDELRDQADAARMLGAGVVEGPVETPWHTVDVRYRDPDGHQVVLTARSPEPRPEAWDQLVRSSVLDPDRRPS